MPSNLENQQWLQDWEMCFQSNLKEGQCQKNVQAAI